MDKRWLLLIPVGFIAYIVLTGKPKNNPSEGKEKYYLKFNKDESFKNLIATEEHFRNVENDIDEEGFLNCAVKHLASCEGHFDEAISHSLIVESKDSSDKFRDLRNDVRWLRHELQSGRVSPSEGIKHVRKIRRKFEDFNDEYDISRCEACEVKVEIIKK